MTVDDEIKEGIRQFIAKRGQKVKFDHRYSDEDNYVSSFGWEDHGAHEHIDPHGYRQVDKLVKGCEWVVPEGTVVKEVSYSQFDGTDYDNRDEVGLNAPGCRCACGKYKDVTLRVVCSLGDAIRGVLGYDSSRQLEL